MSSWTGRYLRWWVLLALLVCSLVAALAMAASSNAPSPNGSSFELGIVGARDGRLAPRLAGRLGARIARVEFSIDDSPQRIASVVGGYARAGVRVLLLAGFIGRVPSAGEAEKLASWAAAFGPGGTFWRGRKDGALAVNDIEFGSETSYRYQFDGCGAGCSDYAPRARAYALAFVKAQQAIAGPRGNPRVGLLAQADDGGEGTEWVSAMFQAVPDLASRVAGWTVHAYGPRSRWQERLDALVAQTAAARASSSIPIYITELGLASDNGRCLSDNYGWSPCMTYAQAGVAMKSTVSAIRARYGARIRAILIYQLADLAASGSGSDREGFFGVMRANGKAKGAYTSTVRALMRAYP